MARTNDVVKTPFGSGVYQGHYAVFGADGQPVELRRRTDICWARKIA